MPELILGGQKSGKSRAAESRAAAWLATLLSIALSRPLYENVLLYQSRYFVILGAVVLASTVAVCWVRRRK